jgi:hypothetical protein
MCCWRRAIAAAARPAATTGWSSRRSNPSSWEGPATPRDRLSCLLPHSQIRRSAQVSRAHLARATRRRVNWGTAERRGQSELRRLDQSSNSARSASRSRRSRRPSWFENQVARARSSASAMGSVGATTCNGPLQPFATQWHPVSSPVAQPGERSRAGCDPVTIFARARRAWRSAKARARNDRSGQDNLRARRGHSRHLRGLAKRLPHPRR